MSRACRGQRCSLCLGKLHRIRFKNSALVLGQRMPDFSRRSDATESWTMSTAGEANSRGISRTGHRSTGDSAASGDPALLPGGSSLLMLDVAAGGCDIGEALAEGMPTRSFTRHERRGLVKLAKSRCRLATHTICLFRTAHSSVICVALLSPSIERECGRVLRQMWRTSRGRVLVNDLHRHPTAYFSIGPWRGLQQERDGKARRPGIRCARVPAGRTLEELARRAGVPARVRRSFPFASCWWRKVTKT